MGWLVNGTPELDARSDFKTVIGVCVASALLMFLTVSLRVWVRRTRLGWDDYLVIIGGVFSIVYDACAIEQTKYGLGLPPALRPAADLDDYSVYNYGARPFLIIGLILFKIALCITYLRMIDRTNHKTYRMVIYVFMGLLTAICIFCVMFNLFSCQPMAKNVHPKIDGTCLPYAPWNFSTWSVNIVLDIMVFLLPIPLFMRMQINRGMRIELSFLFSLSLLTTALSIWKVSQVSRIAYGDGDSTAFVWLSCLELNVGLITSCLPHLRSLVNWRPNKSNKSSSRNIYGMSRLHSKSDAEAGKESPRSESQDDILTEGITKTTYIVVDHETGAAKSSKLGDDWK